MGHARWVTLLAVLLTSSADSSAGEPPATPPPTSTPTTQTADTNLLQQLQDLRQRLEALEAKHADERDQDRRRIAELESKVVELEGRSLDSERRRVYAEQIAGMRAEMDRDNGQRATSQSGTGAEDELSALISGAAATSQPAGQASGPVATLQRAIQSFNPDISLNGDFLGTYATHEGHNPTEKFQLRELEVGFSGAVDPYTRADAIMTIGQEGNDFKADLEEAYLTYLQLPYNLQARFGEFRADFGKVNPVHLHAIPWVDYPLVIQRFFGPEGLKGVGAEVSWLVPNPWHKYIALVYEVINNDNGKLFAGEQANDITQLAHLKTFHDLSPESTLEWGGSFGTGPNDSGHGSHRSLVEGMDLTYRWKPKDAGLYRSFLWQSEVLFSQSQIRGGQESSWGMYTGPEYQFARQWKVGARYDYTQLPFESSAHENAYSVYLTFLQSEFVFWRLAYMYTERNFTDEGVRDNQQIWLQLNWTLGAHPAHKY